MGDIHFPMVTAEQSEPRVESEIGLQIPGLPPVDSATSELESVCEVEVVMPPLKVWEGLEVGL